MPTLAERYQRFYDASCTPDDDATYAAFLAIVGLRAAHGSMPPVPADDTPMRTVPMMVYRVPRPIDLAALETGARAVAKFEDLPEREAARLSARLRGRGFRVANTTPYRRRFDLVWSGSGDDQWLYSVIASRGTEADAVAAAERTRDADAVRRVGTLLGYPPCCVEHFVQLERTAAVERDGVNEVWMRVFAGSATVPWQLNPLSLLSPVGFAPCTRDCPRAVAFAEHILEAVRMRDGGQRSRVETTLQRPVLFFRFPMFYVLDGVPQLDGSVRYTQALANDDGSAVPPALRAWQHRALGGVLARGDRIALTSDRLVVHRGDAVEAAWEIAEPSVPMLLRWARA